MTRRRPGRRFLLIALIGLVAIVVIAAIAVPFLIDVERYRPWIAAKVEEATGRSITLGTIEFHLLPAPAVSVSPLALSEGARYPDRDAVRMREASIRLAPWDLLRGRLTISSIILDQPTLTLIRDAQGRWSYDDLLARAAAVEPAGESPEAEGGGMSVAVRRAVVNAGRIKVYDDWVVKGERSEVEIGPIHATILGWGAGVAPEVDLSIGFGEGRLRGQARLDASEDGGARLEVAPSRLEASDLVALLPWLGVAQPPGMQLGGGMEIEGTATVPLDRPEAVRLEGTVTLDDLSYRDASMTTPISGVGGRLEVTGERAAWDGFTATVGSTTLGGNLNVEGFLKPRVGFALSSERVDFNELIAAFMTGSPAQSAGGQRSPPSAAGGTSGGLLDQVSGRGTFSLGAVRFQTFDVSDAQATVGLKNSVLSLEQLTAAFYGGRLTGSIKLDLSGKVPGYRLATALEAVDCNPAITAFDPELADLLRGKLTGNLDLNGRGWEMDEILSTLRGTGAIEITEGTLTSFSALAKVAELLEMAGGKGIGREETPFEYLRGTLDVSERKARTSDLMLHSADLDLAGRGWVGLDAILDLAVQARFSEESTRGMVAKTSRLGSLTDGEGRLTVYLNVDGDLASPRFGLDKRAQADTVLEKKKERLKEKVGGRLLNLLRGKEKDEEEEESPPPPD